MSDRQNQRGQALAWFAIFTLVIVSFAALAIDNGRLFFVAREAQTVADAAALAGATALARGQDDTQAVLQAQTVALQNSVDNTPVTLIASDVVVGRWNGSTFTTDAPHNAVKTTPHFTINNIFPLWSPTSVTRRQAIAAFEAQGQGAPGLPIVLGSCFVCAPSSCSSNSVNLSFTTSSATNSPNNAAWAVYDTNNGVSRIINYIPTACGGGGATNPTETAGTGISMTGGVATSLCRGFEAQTCKDQLYLVPVVQSSCYAQLNQTGTIIGFATIRILAASCNPPGYCVNSRSTSCSNDNDCGGASGSCIKQYITVQPTFIDCDLPQNATLCQGGSFSSSCTDCGTGKLRLVQ